MTRIGLTLCASIFGLVATHDAIGAVTLGPAVAPRGPGRVSMVWQSDRSVETEVALTAPGQADRTVRATVSDGVQHATINGLTPGVEYQYRVGNRSGRFMAPPDASQQVRFAVLGDSRTGDDAHRAIVSRIAETRPDFYLTTGDAVPDGNRRSQWQKFFDIERPLMSIAPFCGVRGNHDGDATLFEDLVTLRSDTPGSAPTYGSMDLGPAHFVMLDTETAVVPGSPQYVFAEHDLAANHDKPLFVLLHRPLFSSGMHGGNPAIQQALGPLFQRYGVDVVFQGHDHHYERTEPINGVTYIVTGGAGAPLHDAAGGPWTMVKEASHHFMVVEANGTRVHVMAKRSDGSQLDSFDIDPRANNAGRYAHATSMPTAGGGCALFPGVSRSPWHAALDATGSFVPIVGLIAMRGSRRRRNRATTKPPAA